MNLHLAARTFLQTHKNNVAYKELFNEFRDYTMIPEKSFGHTLDVARKAADIAGCIVQCGVWRGGMAAGLVSILGKSRACYLFDSFEGLPQAKEIDGAAAISWQSNRESPTYFDNCSALPEFAAEAMSKAGATNFRLVKGWFEETLSGFIIPEPIAVLHLDADWYESTKTCLTAFYHRVAPGGVIILDDYYTWDGCSRALHDFLSAHSVTERICSLGGICYLKKRA